LAYATERDSKELLTNPAPVAPMLLKAPWLRVALRNLGVSVGDLTDGKIKGYLQSVSCPLYDPERNITDWCSGFVNDCMREAYVCGTNRPDARYWMHWGYPVLIPRLGDVTVFWRVKKHDKDTETWGHVGFFIKYDGQNVVILGGNQEGGRVCFGSYPNNKNRPGVGGHIGILGFRRYEMAIAGDSA
jgi:uncharacterized protein (TIGR02594 family)